MNSAFHPFHAFLFPILRLHSVHLCLRRTWDVPFRRSVPELIHLLSFVHYRSLSFIIIHSQCSSSPSSHSGRSVASLSTRTITLRWTFTCSCTRCTARSRRCCAINRSASAPARSGTASPPPSSCRRISGSFASFAQNFARNFRTSIKPRRRPAPN